MTDRVLRVVGGRIAGQVTAEDLARISMGDEGQSYLNLLRVNNPKRLNDLYEYSWGGKTLLIAGGTVEEGEALFELPATDIILFKRHPEAISAPESPRMQGSRHVPVRRQDPAWSLPVGESGSWPRW